MSRLNQEEAIALFDQGFGGQPELVVRSPGRVNLIGDHTDYNEGFVLPMTIDREVWIVSRRRDDRRVDVWSDLSDHPARFDLDRLERGDDWEAYLQGVAHEMQLAGAAPPGWEGVILSDIPAGAGLSSSAALELATALTFTRHSGARWDPVAMALLAQRAENLWVGVNCGVMDQLVSATGTVGHALLIDCRDLTSRPVTMPAGTAVFVLDTGTRRSLVDSAYNERREACESAALAIGAGSLREVTMETLTEAREALGDEAFRRARHVVTENDRVLSAAGLLEAGDTRGVGLLMTESHRSLRDDFGVSSRALDAMVDAALRAPGCFGARMTGAGLGGSCVALVAAEQAAPFSSAAVEDYRRVTGLSGVAIPVTAVDGTSVVSTRTDV